MFRTVWHTGHDPFWDLADVEALEQAEASLNKTIQNAEDLRAEIRRRSCQLVREAGVVGFKTVGLRFEPPTDRQINDAINAIRRCGQVNAEQRHLINAAIVHETIAASIELNVPVAIHVGLTWDNWVDFHPIHPRHIVPLLLQYRPAKFDLYHLGIPWQDEIAIIAKIYPNPTFAVRHQNRRY